MGFLILIFSKEEIETWVCFYEMEKHWNYKAAYNQTAKKISEDGML